MAFRSLKEVFLRRPFPTICLQYMGNELVVDLNELFVDLLVIFGILVPEQRYN